MRGVVVAGIGTDVGKTVACAVLCEALGAEYWKPIQSGTDDALADVVTVQSLISNGEQRTHPSRYTFRASLSPHAAARAEGVRVALAELAAPVAKAPLVVELAGGILVPINDTVTNLDLIKQLSLPVVVVSRHYLGSINHTLLTCEVLRAHRVPVAGLIFNGSNELPDTESVVVSMTQLPVLARIPTMDPLNREAVQAVSTSVRYAA